MYISNNSNLDYPYLMEMRWTKEKIGETLFDGFLIIMHGLHGIEWGHPLQRKGVILGDRMKFLCANRIELPIDMRWTYGEIDIVQRKVSITFTDEKRPTSTITFTELCYFEKVSDFARLYFSLSLPSHN